VDIEPEELRRQYAELSDDGLLSIDRKDLTEFAQQYYDAEFAQRGLHLESPDPVEAAPDGELVLVEAFLSPTEAVITSLAFRPAVSESTLSQARRPGFFESAADAPLGILNSEF
jgi:hypothetical protein